MLQLVNLIIWKRTNMHLYFLYILSSLKNFFPFYEATLQNFSTNKLYESLEKWQYFVCKSKFTSLAYYELQRYTLQHSYRV